MKLLQFAVFSLFLVCALSAQILTFTQQPQMAKISDSSYTIEFTVSETTDVEVAVVDLADSTIVRHLAAGKLGNNPPAPLLTDTLHQVLAWDGKDDFGNALGSGSYGVRVRAGMAASLSGFAGGDPSRFYVPGTSGYWKFKGLAANPDGLIYAYGSITGSGVMTVRCYDASGNYVRTVFPFPADKPSTQVQGFGINLWQDGTYSPKTSASKAQCNLSTLIIGEPDNNNGYDNGRGAIMMPVNEAGRLFFYGRANLCMAISTDGTRPGDATQVPFITSPALPASDRKGGTVFLCSSPDSLNYYMSGLWERSGDSAINTGFWKDGQVFKVNKTTGVATPFISLDTVPVSPAARSVRIGPSSGADNCFQSYSAIHGMACDDSGRIFLCDRHHARISVYDTSGSYLGGIPVKSPEMISVNNSNGTIYVVSRDVTGWFEGVIKLYKFNGWRNSPAPACSTLVSTDVDYYASSAYLAVPAGQNLIWVGHVRMDGMMIYRDEGTSFILVKNMGAQSRAFLGGIDRPAVDRRTESVFINDGWAGIGRIEDWSTGEILPCTLSNGERLRGHDMAVSYQGLLYVQGPSSCGDSINRYTLDHNPAPANYANTGDNCLTPGSWSHLGANFGFKGMGVGPAGQVAVVAPVDWPAYWAVGELADSGQTQFVGPLGCDVMPYEIDTVVDLVGGLAASTTGGFRYDIQGNLYVGDAIRSRYHTPPSGFESDVAYERGVGAIFKLNKSGRGRIADPGCCDINNDAEANSSGFARIYREGFGPYSAAEYCACRTPRFDVDPYGRLFIPNAFTQKVAVVDNNDNPILTFGDYGNYDAQGPGIPLCWPTGVAASENYAYVTDFGNGRLARVKLDYELESMHLPDLAADGGRGVLQYAPTAVIAAPNPFNPSVILTLTGALAKDASLRVFDLSGKLVADLSGGISAGRAVWNAAGNASGMYVAVAQKDALRLTRKIVYSK